MIHIDRSAVPVPAVFSSPRLGRARAQLEAVFREDVSRRPQASPFASFPQDRAKGTLAKLFHHKCAYCESPLTVTNVFEVDLFRPRRLGGDPQARDHYWWLAYEWKNMLLACPTCSSAKRDRFPILGPRAVPPPGRHPSLAEERPLLLDPTLDQPAQFLRFTRDGQVLPSAAARSEAARQRAETTIELLQLNRPTLQKERSFAATEIVTLIDQCLSSSSANLGEHVGNLARAIADDGTYAGARRSVCAQHGQALLKLSSRSSARAHLRTIRSLISDWLPPPAPAPAARMPAARAGMQPRAPSAAPSPKLATIASVSLRDFRLLEKIDFTIPEKRPPDLRTSLFDHAVAAEPDEADAPGAGNGPAGTEPGTLASDDPRRRTWGWKMILGENGAGKSSILQAIAVALMGEDFYERNAEAYGLRSALRSGASRGRIAVQLAEYADPFEVELRPDGMRWLRSPAGAEFFLRGYGVTRLLPPRGSRPPETPPGRAPLKQVDNLFDPHASLIDAEGWLRHLDEHDFFNASVALKILLNLADTEGNLAFEKDGPPRSGPFGIRRGSHFTPLDQFSAGYQTMLALACDIMAGTGATVDAVRAMPGIILVDEIGANLHPRWRMDIIHRLEKAFPGMQFIASTHEPLCLRGLGRGEVAVVQRTGAHVELHDNLPSPAGLRIDQLLTSEFFGLHTTIDPEIEQSFDIYYDLLARGSELNREQRRLRDQLGRELNRRSVLGSSRRDQFILAVVNDFLARHPRAVRGEALPRPSPEVRRLIEQALSEIELPESPLAP